jgi:GntR family transcriptional regulator/MocR family aminotransferase
LGFVVAPVALAQQFGEVAGCLNPASNSTTQLALASFLADGHYLRHLRHMKTLYRSRREALHARLGDAGPVDAMAGLAVLKRLPPGTDDVALCRRALEAGIAPAPLSPWYAASGAIDAGLLLGVTNLDERQLELACVKLAALIEPFGAHRRGALS